MPVSLFDIVLNAARFGHELEPGRVQVEWSPRICQPAKRTTVSG
jgi:hypothetical protein